MNAIHNLTPVLLDVFLALLGVVLETLQVAISADIAAIWKAIHGVEHDAFGAILTLFV